MAVVENQEEVVVLDTQTMSGFLGVILCVSGAMGAGKSTLVRILTGNVQGLTNQDLIRFIIHHHRLLKDCLRSQFHLDLSDRVGVVPSYTTRAKRGDEMDGEYIFVNRDDFLEMIDGHRLAWWAEVNNRFYGTLWTDLSEQLVKPGFGVVNVTPETVVYHIYPKLFKTGRFKAVYVDSPHRQEWMSNRGGLSPDVVHSREEINQNWDRLVTGAGDMFVRLENDEAGNLHNLIHDLSGLLGRT